MVPENSYIRTCGCSPCLKKASSLALSLAASRAKYLGSETSSILAWSTPARSIFCEVAMTYRELTRLRGTPLILKGPVTRRTPWSRVLRSTTRLPRNRPARRIRTVPGVRESRGAQGRRVLRTYCESHQRLFLSSCLNASRLLPRPLPPPLIRYRTSELCPFSAPR